MRDHVAVFQQGNRPAMCGLWPHVAHAEPACRARETAVGDQRHLLAHALAGQGRRGRQHFAHAGAACGAFVADDDALRLLYIRAL